MNLKHQRIIVGIFTIILMGIIAGVIVYNKNLNNPKKQKNTYATTHSYEKEASGSNLNASQKKLMEIDEDSKTTKEDEEQYTDIYREYLTALEEDGVDSEAVPRKNEITWVYLDTIKKKEDESFKKYEESKKNEDVTKKEDTSRKDESTKKDDEKDAKKDDSQKRDETTGLPTKYNLADSIKIQVENQGGFGLCWDFASMKSLETHLAVKGLGDYDLSEIHLDYIESKLLYGSRNVHEGGNFDMFEDYLNISGVVYEKDAQYRDYGEAEYKNFIDINSPITITETVNFPAIHKFLDEDDIYTERYTDEQIKEYRDTVKKHIMANGGLYCYIATPDPGTSFFNEKTSAEYCDLSYGELPRGVHAVTIIGWDDNYSKDNFKTFKKPAKDGAYIVVNSWGLDYGDKGYYYISYEDKYVEEDLNGIISTSFADAYNVEMIKNNVIKDYLKENYSNSFRTYNGAQYITKLSLARITSLDLSKKGMTSLDGIEMFPNVNNLNLSDNNIKDFSPLTKLNGLSTLYLASNNITDIGFLENMTNKYMYDLDLSNNKITDLTPIQNNKYLSYAALNLSGNDGLFGYEKINGVSTLNISNCGIKELPQFDPEMEIYSLDLSKNKEISRLENIPDSVWHLNISECGIKDFSAFEGRNISNLNVSKNEITKLDGIDKMEFLFTLDVSENPIEDWNALSLLKGFGDAEEYANYIEENDNQDLEEYEDFYDYYDYYDTSFNLYANNCKINDLSVFNKINKSCLLEIKNNNITDFSALNNPHITMLDISDNKGIVSFPNTKEIHSLYATDCDIKTMDNIPDYSKLICLDLSMNNLSDIGKLANYKRLQELSLAENKNIKGTISNENLSLVNLSGCDLKDGDIDIASKNITFLNLKNNPKLTVLTFITKIESDFLSMDVDTISYDQYKKITDNDENIYVYTDKGIEINTFLGEDGSINLNSYKDVKEKLMKFTPREICIKNGTMRRNRYVLDAKNKESKSIIIDFPYSNDFIIVFGSINEEANPTVDVPTLEENKGTIERTIELEKAKTTTTSKTTSKEEKTKTEVIEKTRSEKNENKENSEKSQNSNVIGTWNINSATKDGAEVQLSEIYGSGIKYGGSLVLNEDGTYTKYIGITSDETAGDSEGTYIIEGNSITLTSKNGNIESASYTDGSISLNDNNGYTLNFKK